MTGSALSGPSTPWPRWTLSKESTPEPVLCLSRASHSSESKETRLALPGRFPGERYESTNLIRGGSGDCQRNQPEGIDRLLPGRVGGSGRDTRQVGMGSTTLGRSGDLARSGECTHPVYRACQL